MTTSKVSGSVNVAPGYQCEDVTVAWRIVLDGGVGVGGGAGVGAGGGAGVGAGEGGGGGKGGVAGGSAGGGSGVVCATGCVTTGAGAVGDPPHATRKPSARTSIVCITLPPAGEGAQAVPQICEILYC
jgi:hypothetical protein